MGVYHSKYLKITFYERYRSQKHTQNSVIIYIPI